MKNNKPKVYTIKNYKKCHYYECGFCYRMSSYLVEGRELCPLGINEKFRIENECPYYEPQFSIDEEEEMSKYYEETTEQI